MQGITDYIGQLPEPVQLILASVGFLFLANKSLGYVKFLLGVFVLGGTNVSSSLVLLVLRAALTRVPNSFASMANLEPGLS